jgi:uncharacterized protein (TIGR03435 family)
LHPDVVFTVLVLAPVAQPRASDPEQRFEAAVVKRYDHRNDRNIPPLGVVSLFGCYLGPGRLQYNCSDSVPRLVAEALNLSDFQFEKAGPPEYVITAKLSEPATRQQMNDMLARFLQGQMGVQYHLEKKPIKADFLTVASQELLKKLPAPHDPVPLAYVSSGRQLGLGMPSDVQFCNQKPGLNKDELQTTCTNINFNLRAQILYRYYGVPIIDETGLTTRGFGLDFTTKVDPEDLWTPDHGKPAWNLSEIRNLLRGYGISLQRREGVTDFLVIDHVAVEAAFLN